MDGGEGFEEELGDLLFSCVNVSRFLKVDAEQALKDACEKFASRFAEVEKLANDSGRELSDMTLSEMDGLWDKVKSKKPEC